MKTGALTLLSELCRVAPEEMARNLPTTVPALTAAMADAKRQVQVWPPVASAHRSCLTIAALFVPRVLGRRCKICRVFAVAAAEPVA